MVAEGMKEDIGAGRREVLSPVLFVVSFLPRRLLRCLNRVVSVGLSKTTILVHVP